MDVVRLDDRNSLLSYSPTNQWKQGGVQAEYNGTTTYTFTAGANASLYFYGTNITVWGTLSLSKKSWVLQQTSYSIDYGIPTIFISPSLNSSTTEYHQLFFQSSVFPLGLHTLTITNLVDRGAFFLDYIDLATIPAPDNSTNQTPLSTTMPNASFASPATTSSSASSMEPQVKSNIPFVIVGSLLGGLLLVIWLTFIVMHFKNRFLQYKDSNEVVRPFLRTSQLPPDNRELRMSLKRGRLYKQLLDTVSQKTVVEDMQPRPPTYVSQAQLETQTHYSQEYV